MKIGALAAAAGTSAETIRYYEREGLLDKPARSGANYRLYGAADAERLHFIRRCRSLDMALPEIRRLLAARDRRDGCAEANALLDEHIGHVTERIRELQALEVQLRGLRSRCDTRPAGEPCAILSELAQEPSRDGADAVAGPAHGPIAGAHPGGPGHPA